MTLLGLGPGANVVLLGEAGCGKSEVALALALDWAAAGDKVDFFDLDQTKPLFRGRDCRGLLGKAGVRCHFQGQVADEPTQVGGLAAALRDGDRRCVLDSGGGVAGARLVGAVAQALAGAVALYVVNPYRAWSGDIAAVDATLTAVLAAARLPRPRFVLNPYLGPGMTAAEWRAGYERGAAMLSPFTAIEAAAAPGWLAGGLTGLGVPLWPLAGRINMEL